MYIPHWFIQSSISGHFCCFHLLAVVNTVAMNEGMQTSFQVCFQLFWGYAQKWHCWIMW